MNTAFALITADDDTKAVVQAKFDAGESVTVREIEELKRQAAAAKRLAMNNSKSSQTLSEWLDRFTLSAEETARRERAALRLKERLSLVPFYANRAAEYRAEGGDEAEMAYWRRLHGSAMLSD